MSLGCCAATVMTAPAPGDAVAEEKRTVTLPPGVEPMVSQGASAPTAAVSTVVLEAPPSKNLRAALASAL